MMVPAGLSGKQFNMPPPTLPATQTDSQTETLHQAYETIERELGARMNMKDRELERLARVIVDESLYHDFDPLFVLAVIHVESLFDPKAVSPTGAKGLMQIVNSTFREQIKINKLEGFRVFNPEHNVKVGIGYLAFLGQSFKRPERLLLAYNQGPSGANAILNHGAVPTEEAATYASKVLRVYKRLLKKHNVEVRNVRTVFRSPERTLVRR